MAQKPASAPRLHQEVMRLLLTDIGMGQIRPGDRLPAEGELAKRLGVSRGIVRETLRGLEERGIVEVRQGRGATVTDTVAWNVLDPEVMRALIQTPDAGPVLRELLHCRKLIEIDAAGLAAEHATGDDLTQMTDAYSRMVAAAERAPNSGDAEEIFHAADTEFHRSIVNASGNRVLARLVEPIQATLRKARPALARPEERFDLALPEHRRILSAIAEGDVDKARSAMADHLETVERHLREYEEHTGRPSGAAEPVAP
jgi:DNA-binding FadR family transcriptional regulator